MTRTPAGRVLRQAGRCSNLELCASYQVQCRLAILYFQTQPNAKPENVGRHYTKPNVNKDTI